MRNILLIWVTILSNILFVRNQAVNATAQPLNNTTLTNATNITTIDPRKYSEGNFYKTVPSFIPEIGLNSSQCFTNLKNVIGYFSDFEQAALVLAANSNNQSDRCFDCNVYSQYLPTAIEKFNTQISELITQNREKRRNGFSCFLNFTLQGMEPLINSSLAETVLSYLYFYSDSNICITKFLQDLGQVILENRRFLCTTINNMKVMALNDTNGQMVGFKWTQPQANLITNSLVQLAGCLNKERAIIPQTIVNAMSTIALSDSCHISGRNVSALNATLNGPLPEGRRLMSNKRFLQTNVTTIDSTNTTNSTATNTVSLNNTDSNSTAQPANATSTSSTNSTATTTNTTQPVSSSNTTSSSNNATTVPVGAAGSTSSNSTNTTSSNTTQPTDSTGNSNTTSSNNTTVTSTGSSTSNTTLMNTTSTSSSNTTNTTSNNSTSTNYVGDTGSSSTNTTTSNTTVTETAVLNNTTGISAPSNTTSNMTLLANNTNDTGNYLTLIGNNTNKSEYIILSASNSSAFTLQSIAPAIPNVLLLTSGTKQFNKYLNIGNNTAVVINNLLNFTNEDNNIYLSIKDLANATTFKNNTLYTNLALNLNRTLLSSYSFQCMPKGPSIFILNMLRGVPLLEEFQKSNCSIGNDSIITITNNTVTCDNCNQSLIQNEIKFINSTNIPKQYFLSTGCLNGSRFKFATWKDYSGVPFASYEKDSVNLDRVCLTKAYNCALNKGSYSYCPQNFMTTTCRNQITNKCTSTGLLSTIQALNTKSNVDFIIPQECSLEKLASLMSNNQTGTSIPNQLPKSYVDSCFNWFLTNVFINSFNPNVTKLTNLDLFFNTNNSTTQNTNLRMLQTTTNATIAPGQNFIVAEADDPTKNDTIANKISALKINSNSSVVDGMTVNSNPTNRLDVLLLRTAQSNPNGTITVALPPTEPQPSVPISTPIRLSSSYLYLHSMLYSLIVIFLLIN